MLKIEPTETRPIINNLEYIMDNQERQQNQTEAKRSRRSISKFNKEVPRYECFCSKQYLSYPALYLHLKNKHQSYFLNSKNGKKVETTKLIESFDSNEGFKVYRISIDSLNPQRQKHDLTVPSVKHLEGQGFSENPIYFQANNCLAYGNIPYQFPYQYMTNKEQSSPIVKDAFIQSAFSLFFESLNPRSAKDKAQAQLLLGLVIYCINQNYTILRQLGEQMQFRRYTAQQNCKYLSVFLSFFQKKWLLEAIKQENKFYSFFVKHASIIVQGKYKKLFQELLQFFECQRLEDISQAQLIKSKSLVQNFENGISEPPGHSEVSNSEPKSRVPENSPK